MVFMEISIVMPCLNEAETVGACIMKAKQALKKMDENGEIIVADNGSNLIALSLGAKVVRQPVKGYGSACRAGIEAAQGKYIVCADSDDTYDLRKGI